MTAVVVCRVAVSFITATGKTTPVIIPIVVELEPNEVDS